MANSYNMNKLTFITPAFVSILAMIFTSCDEPDIISATMVDGQNILLRSEDIHFYDSESEFMACPVINIPCDYSFLSGNENQFQTGREYCLEGYDDRFLILWEKASFGDWISDYGLIPNEEYYCAWLKYVLYLPALKDADYIPVFPMDNMGHVSWTDKRCFDIEYKKVYPKEILYTYVRYIGYDQNKKGIYKEIPKINKLVWKFTSKE